MRAMCSRASVRRSHCADHALSYQSVGLTTDWNSKSTLFLLVSRLKLNGVTNLVFDLISRFVNHVFVYFFKSVFSVTLDLLHTDISDIWVVT